MSNRKRIALLLVTLLVMAWFGFPTTRIAYYDHKLRGLCAGDGGIRVYEQAAIPAKSFDSFGRPRVPEEGQARDGDLYFYRDQQEWLIPESNPSSLSVVRWKRSVVRKKDGLVIAEAITYIRRGGDPLGPWQSSSLQCPDNSKFESLTFVRAAETGDAK